MKFLNEYLRKSYLEIIFENPLAFISRYYFTVQEKVLSSKVFREIRKRKVKHSKDSWYKLVVIQLSSNRHTNVIDIRNRDTQVVIATDCDSRGAKCKLSFQLNLSEFLARQMVLILMWRIFLVIKIANAQLASTWDKPTLIYVHINRNEVQEACGIHRSPNFIPWDMSCTWR